MPNTVIAIRSSGTAAATPSLGVLANGEISLNFADGIIYYKTSSNTLGSIKTTQPAGLTTEVQFNDAGSFGGDSGFTFNKTTKALTVTGNLTAANVTTSGQLKSLTGVVTDQLTVNNSAAYDSQGEIIAYGTGRNMLIVQTSDNSQERGMAFRNSGGAYIGTFYIKDRGLGDNTGNMHFGVANTTHTVVTDVPDRMVISTDGLVTISGNLIAGNISTGGALAVTGNTTLTQGFRALGSVNSIGDLVSNTTFNGVSTRSLNLVGTSAVLRVARTNVTGAPAVELLSLNPNTAATLSHWDFYADGNTDTFSLRRRTGGAEQNILVANNTLANIATNVLITGNLTAANVTSQSYVQFGDGTRQYTANAGSASAVTSVAGATGAVSNTQILTGLLTVDGSGSGLDADLLDGQQGSFYIDTSSSTQTKSGNLSITGSLTVDTNTLHVDAPNNRVGIGTTSPTSKLQVDGTVNLRVMSTFQTAGSLEFNRSDGTNRPFFIETFNDSVAANNYMLFKVHNGTVGATANVMSLLGSGNVGIGTQTPGYKLEVNGSFAATTKSFVIPHPTKKGKKLRYGSLEGPENGVYIRGKTTERIIKLPAYWTKLVDSESITVNLTPIGEYQQLYVEKIEKNKVYIKNAASKNINCHYTIYGERCDVEKLEVEV
jgi:hypothetical protein